MQHRLDHEKRDVYQIELQFVAWSTERMVVSMLSKRVDRFSPATPVREDHVRYRIEDDDENDSRDGSSV